MNDIENRVSAETARKLDKKLDKKLHRWMKREYLKVRIAGLFRMIIQMITRPFRKRIKYGGYVNISEVQDKK